MAIEVACVPVLSDNYAWLINDSDSSETVAVDPGEAQPLIDAAAARGWTITQIWNTHWHPDHVAGNAALRDATGAPITGPAAEAAKIGTLDHRVADGNAIPFAGTTARVIAIPGHTAGHIAFHLPGHIFVGDTLFAMGCGKLLEGTPEDMFASLRALDALPDETLVYAGHEYTEANGRFALVAEPDNAAIATRMKTVRTLRADGRPTLPTTIAEERATNPFLRAPDADELGRRRAAKDAFRG